MIASLCTLKYPDKKYKNLLRLLHISKSSNFFKCTLYAVQGSLQSPSGKLIPRRGTCHIRWGLHCQIPSWYSSDPDVAGGRDTNGLRWLHCNVWRKNHRVPQECNHRPVGRSGRTSAKQQTGSGMKEWVPFLLLGGYGAGYEIFPRDV